MAVTNQLAQVTSEYNQATNDLASAKQAGINATNALMQSQVAVDEARAISQQEAPRLFTDFQKKYGKSMLGPLAGTPVTIVAVMDDQEAYSFQQILNTFLNDDAGWKSTDGGRMMFNLEPKGIVICARNSSDILTCKKLAEFLHSCNFTVHIQPSQSGVRPSGPNGIEIIIGPK